MSLYAMKAVLDSGVEFNRKVWLIVGTSEEGEWTDMETFKNEFTVLIAVFPLTENFQYSTLKRGMLMSS